MDLTLEALKQTDGRPTVPPVTVSLPLVDPTQEDGRNGAGAKQPRGRTKQKNQRGPAIEQFTFPNLPEVDAAAPTPTVPTVIWPECDVTETVSACAEAARNILRHLSLDRPRMVLFTSPSDGDGKTGLLLTLAPELAKRTTGSVLVVDANCRNPDLTAQLHVPGGETRVQATLIYPTNLPRLSFLPAAPASKNASRSAQGLPSHGFDPSTNEELRAGWSLVLVDTPSLAHPEVAPMMQRCDGVYLVVRLGHTARRAVVEAARVIRLNGGRLLGCVAVG
jgi:Mrp family chromosome partitioning ATPase